MEKKVIWVRNLMYKLHLFQFKMNLSSRKKVLMKKFEQLIEACKNN